MRKIKLLTLTFFLILGFTVVSCKKEKADLDSPIISLHAPVNSQVFKAGSSIEFKALFSDDKALGQYKIEIYDDFVAIAAQPWSKVIIEDLSGQSSTVEKSIEIPQHAEAGLYYLVVNCLDASGKEASSLKIEINIEN